MNPIYFHDDTSSDEESTHPEDFNPSHGGRNLSDDDRVRMMGLAVARIAPGAEAEPPADPDASVIQETSSTSQAPSTDHESSTSEDESASQGSSVSRETPADQGSPSNASSLIRAVLVGWRCSRVNEAFHIRENNRLLELLHAKHHKIIVYRRALSQRPNQSAQLATLTQEISLLRQGREFLERNYQETVDEYARLQVEYRVLQERCQKATGILSRVEQVLQNVRNGNWFNRLGRFFGQLAWIIRFMRRVLFQDMLRH